MMNFNLDNLSEIIDEVLTEFCVTYPIPNFDNKEQLEHLRSVLEQFGAEAFTDIELMEAISLAPKKFTLEAPKKDGTDPKLAAILKKKVKNADTGRDVTVASALNYKDQKGSGARSAYHAAAAMLKGAGYSEKNVDMIDDPNPEEPQYYAKQKPQEKPNSKVAPQQKSTKSGPIIDDPKLAKVTISAANKELAKIIKAGGIPTKDGVGIITALTKTLNGQNLNAKEKQIAANYLRVKDNPTDAAVYIVYPPGKATKHIKVKVGNKNLDKLVQYGKNNFGNSNDGNSSSGPATPPVPKKGVTAMSINPNSVDTPIKHDGNSFQFGNGQKIEKVNLPKRDELVKSFIKNQKMSAEEANKQADKLIIAAEQNNGVVDYFSKGGNNIKMIDWGAEPTTNEGRNTILKNVKEKSIKKFESFFRKANKGQLRPEEAQILKFYNDTKSPYETPNFDKLPPEQQKKLRDEYVGKIEHLMELMVKSPSFRQGVPDFVEVLRYSAYLGQGYEAYLPADSTFQISDIIVFAPRDILKQNTQGKDLAEQITGKVSNIIESLVFTGGVSEKFLEGGASSGIERVLQSEFFGGKDGKFKTKDRTLEMMNTYTFAFRNKDRFAKQNPRLEGFDKDYKAAIKVGKTEEEATEYAKKEASKRWTKLSKEEQSKKLGEYEDIINQLPDDKEIDKQEKMIESYIDDAVKSGIISKEEAFKIRKEGQHQGDLIAGKVDKKGAGNCLDKKGKDKYKRMVSLWARMGAAVEQIYNKDLKYTLFKNSRELFDGKGNFKKNQLLNKCGMSWSYDPGIAATANVQNGPKGCMSLAMNNPNSSHIISLD
jgi:hypothetical protein